MSTLLFTVAALACPMSMGAMMWLMVRGSRAERSASDAASVEAEVDRLQAEIGELRAAVASRAYEGRQGGEGKPHTLALYTTT